MGHRWVPEASGDCLDTLGFRLIRDEDSVARGWRAAAGTARPEWTSKTGLIGLTRHWRTSRPKAPRPANQPSRSTGSSLRIRSTGSNPKSLWTRWTRSSRCSGSIPQSPSTAASNLRSAWGHSRSQASPQDQQLNGSSIAASVRAGIVPFARPDPCGSPGSGLLADPAAGANRRKIPPWCLGWRANGLVRRGRWPVAVTVVAGWTEPGRRPLAGAGSGRDAAQSGSARSRAGSSRRVRSGRPSRMRCDAALRTRGWRQRR